MATTIDVSYFNSFYIQSDASADNWHVEESRIKGEYNGVSVDLGVRAYIIDENFTEERRKNALIYSGIFNSQTGINNTNQFSPAEPITKAVNSANGSIQKLYAEETNLIILQEDKVSRALIDKDAIFSAEGGGTVTSSSLVIGQIVPFSGKYGISTNPESFAKYGTRKYFADKNRGVILRLSSGVGGGDGLTPISDYGMRSYFRDNLKKATKIVGAFDTYHQQYVVSMQGDNLTNETVTFDDYINGWTSKHTYELIYGFSILNNFYTFKNSNIFKHYNSVNYGNYYGSSSSPSSVTISVNGNVAVENIFQAVSYEGSSKWSMKEIKTDVDSSSYVDSAYDIDISTVTLSDLYVGGSIFKKRGNKYYADLFNSTPVKENEIQDAEVSGIKGYFMQAKFETSNDNNNKQELFAVNTTFNNTTI